MQYFSCSLSYFENVSNFFCTAEATERVGTHTHITSPHETTTQGNKKVKHYTWKSIINNPNMDVPRPISITLLSNPLFPYLCVFLLVSLSHTTAPNFIDGQQAKHQAKSVAP